MPQHSSRLLSEFGHDLAAAFELINELETMGYLTRQPDAADGRAKLIELTERGRDAMRAAGRRVADTEHRWSKVVGASDFAHMCQTMQRLLDELAPCESEAERPTLTAD